MLLTRKRFEVYEVAINPNHYFQTHIKIYLDGEENFFLTNFFLSLLRPEKKLDVIICQPVKLQLSKLRIATKNGLFQCAPSANQPPSPYTKVISLKRHYIFTHLL